MESPSALRVFDTDADAYANHWIVRTTDGTFLVPARRGGWARRRRFADTVTLIPLEPSQSHYVWSVLAQAEERQERELGA